MKGGVEIMGMHIWEEMHSSSLLFFFLTQNFIYLFVVIMLSLIYHFVIQYH